MLISFVIPAFNASVTIARTLESVFGDPLPEHWSVEAIVVDDGSPDGDALMQIVESYPSARTVRHASNRGMCAARNAGISESKGDRVTILDADDELVEGWPKVLEDVLLEWPQECQLCFAACRNDQGGITAQEPAYQGYLTLDDLLNERHTGEYLPIFRGEYVRAKPYIDLGMRKSCGIVSYINFAHDGPIWVSNRVLRIYHEGRTGSVSKNWFTPDKAAETVRCYEALFDRYGDLYRKRARRVYSTKLLRLAVYRKLANLPGAWSVFFQGASVGAWRETLAVAVMLLLGRKVAGRVAAGLKGSGVIRRYG